MYGKLIDGAFAPYTGGYIRHNGRVYTNVAEATLVELGYKPLIEAEYPEEREGYYPVSEYTEEDDAIQQSWRYEPEPEPEYTTEYGEEETVVDGI